MLVRNTRQRGLEVSHEHSGDWQPLGKLVSWNDTHPGLVEHLQKLGTHDKDVAYVEFDGWFGTANVFQFYSEETRVFFAAQPPVDIV